MRGQFDDKLQQLEADIGSDLRSLPSVEPPPGLVREVWSRLQNELGKSASVRGERGYRRWKMPRLGLVAAALLLVLGGSWLAGLFLQQSETATIGPLLMPTAQASVGQIGDLTFRLGLQNQLVNLTWQLNADLPTLPGDLPVLRFQRPQWTEENGRQLASSLGISSIRPARPSIGSSVYLEGSNGRLWLDLERGSWQFEATESGDGEAITAQSAEESAVSWLRKAGILGQEEITIHSQPDDSNFWVDLRLATGPGGSPVVSGVPGFRMLVVRGNHLAAAYGAWYREESSFNLPISTYRQALQALQNGEGDFNAPGFSPYDGGTAEIKQAHLGYQLAYSLDYTPYLVPVAVFSGDYRPEQGIGGQFTAYVSLLKTNSRHNAGNFQLASSLPVVGSSAPVMKERPLAISQSKLAALQQFFGMTEAVPDEYGTLRQGASELSATSWDGGWLWRGTWQSREPVQGPLTVEQATAIARELAEQLPDLPGALGEPEQPLADPQDGFYWICFPLLYQGLPVESLGAPSYSWIAIQVNAENGQVTTVNCAKPMQLQDSQVELITPEQAWKKLLDNQAVIQLESMFEQLPAARFQVEQSLITDVQLAYVPRDPALARNEYYDLKYLFRGTAEVGERTINFIAIVDAE